MKLSSIIALLLMMVICLPSCSDDYYVETQDENGVEYISYKDTYLERDAQHQAAGDHMVGSGPQYKHYYLFKKLPQNAHWEHSEELIIEVDKDGGPIQLETSPKALGIIQNVLSMPLMHTHGWYFFPYYVLDPHTFLCYITHPTEYECTPQKILFGDVLRSPFCTVYGDKGALTIDVKRNNSSKDRTFTVRYAMSEYDTYKSSGDLQQQLADLLYQHKDDEEPYSILDHINETDVLKYTQVDITIKQKH